MPRCLMAKKWKVSSYPWTTDGKAIEEESPVKKVSPEEDEDEEIDVVTIQQSGSETKPILLPYHHQCRAEENTTEHHRPCPQQNLYGAGPDDYANETEQSKCPTISSRAPSVIQQHSSALQLQQQQQQQHIRLTSVIHHSGSLLTSPQHNGEGDQHQSASPVQPQNTWGPSSPTEGATAPSLPSHIQHSSHSDPTTTIHYNGYTSAADISHYAAYLPGESATSPSYVTLQSANESRPAPLTRTRSLAMCFTSTGAALSLPPKKKDIYRPYSLDDRPSVRWRPPEDLSAAHAILDLSASPPAPTPIEQQPLPSPKCINQPSPSPAGITKSAAAAPPTKTVAYTYEAFFVSDGRSKKKAATAVAQVENNVTVISAAGSAAAADHRPKYTCSECGKQYATSSNLSRHKQTHRSLDSQSAKKCVTCGKAYVSMPALAMHLLTHKLNHACGICGKLFSRPWLLQGHLRSHTGEKPYGCAHCGKAFADRSNLRAHMQTHSTDKNFECTRCHKTFALKSYLNKHLESACIGETECNTTAIPNQVPTITHLR